MPNPHDEQSSSQEISVYEKSRFHSSARGKALNRRELRIVRWFFEQLPKESNLLDVPTGTGRFIEIASECGHKTTAIDKDPERANFAKKKFTQMNVDVDIRVGDIFDLPLADNSVDAAICIRLFHWFDEEQIRQALAELSRVSPQVLLTYYSKHTIEGCKKIIHGFRGNATNYTPKEIISWAHEVGYSPHRTVKGTGCYRRCQFLWLSR